MYIHSFYIFTSKNCWSFALLESSLAPARELKEGNHLPAAPQKAFRCAVMAEILKPLIKNLSDRYISNHFIWRFDIWYIPNDAGFQPPTLALKLIRVHQKGTSCFFLLKNTSHLQNCLPAPAGFIWFSPPWSRCLMLEGSGASKVIWTKVCLGGGSNLKNHGRSKNIYIYISSIHIFGGGWTIHLKKC